MGFLFRLFGHFCVVVVNIFMGHGELSTRPQEVYFMDDMLMILSVYSIYII